MKKKLIIIITALVLLLIITGAYTTLRTPKFSDSVSQNTMVLLPLGEVSSDFPEGILLDTEAIVVNSYMGITPEGKQSTLIFKTRKSIYGLMTQYRNFLTERNWMIENPALKGLSADTSAFTLSNQRLVIRYVAEPVLEDGAVLEWTVFIDLVVK